VAADVVLFLGDLLPLLLHLSLECQQALGALGHERGVPATIGRCRPLGHVQDVVDRRVEKSPVVTDDDDRFAELAEVVAQPVDGIEIEMVGGLVEQHEVGGRGQLCGESQAACSPPERPARRGARLGRISQARSTASTRADS
jgi:hypothetical protein